MRFAVDRFSTEPHNMDDVEAIAAAVVGHMQTGAAHTILIKGSRFMGMERVVAALLSASESLNSTQS